MIIREIFKLAVCSVHAMAGIVCILTLRESKEYINSPTIFFVVGTILLTVLIVSTLRWCSLIEDS